MITLDSFQDYLSAPHVGSSHAKLALKSRQLFRDYETGVYKIAERSHHSIGRLVHMMVLEPERFAKQTVAHGPINERTGQPYGRDTQAFLKWQAENPNVTVVDHWVLTMLSRMPSSLRDLFAAGVCEQSVYQEVSRLLVKCRNDHLNGNIITDLKTCDDVDRADRDIAKWQYWFQAGWYKMVNKLETGREYQFQWVFAEKNPPYRWRLVKMDVDYQLYSDNVVDDTIAKILTARDSGTWEDDGELEVMASRPDYLTDDTDEEGDE
jgi:hypothetical protein